MSDIETLLVQMITNGLLGCKTCEAAWDALQGGLHHSSSHQDSGVNGDGS